MTPWRDTTSEQAQNDLDGLLNTVLLFAEQTLVKHGGLYPFGAGVSEAGEVEMLAADPALGDTPPAGEVLAALYEAVGADAARWRAVSFVANRALSGGDEIRVELEHREKVALVLSMPYTRDAGTGEVTTGAMVAGAGEPRVWAS